MSQSDPPVKVPLHVRTNDQAGEICVTDGLFRPVAAGIGNLSVDLPRGVYKVKAREGFAEKEDFVILRDEPVTRSFTIRFSSPIPLNDTAEQDPLHIGAIQEHCARAHFCAGEGSSIFVFERCWGCGITPIANRRVMDSLNLHTATGELIVALGKRAYRSGEVNPWAACSVEVRPGAYRLTGTTFKGSPIEHTVMAVPGYQTQIYLMCRTTPHGEVAGNDLPDATVVYARERTFDPDSRDRRLAELARLGLRTDRNVLPDDTVSEILAGTFRDPILGLHGAHLITRLRRPDATDLKLTIARLRQFLGPAHPDVEALTLYPGGTPTSFAFTVPPPMKKSWLLVVEASARNPALVPRDSVSARVARDLSADEPWLFWSPDDGGKQSANDALKQALNTVAAHINLGKISKPPATLVGSVANFAVMKWLWSMKRSAAAPGTEAKLPQADSALLKSAVSEATIEALVNTLRLPRGNVEQMIENFKKVVGK